MIRRIRRWGMLAAGTAAAAATLAQAPDRAFPALRLPRAVRGDEAVAALGPRLREVAAYYHKTEGELGDLLRRERALWLDEGGRLQYVCEFGAAPPEAAAGDGTGDPIVYGPYPTAQTFLLHSRSNATRKIYLDFDGHTTSGTAWKGGASFYTPPFDLDDDPDTFNQSEHDRIQYIWQRVAEDYVMYEVDVTTEDPGVEGLRKSSSGDTAYGIRCSIGGSSSDWYGNGAGGVAYIGSFDWNSDTPCFAFQAQLAGGAEKATAEAVSHEVGHTLDLYHDGTTTGTEYYGGHGNWAPIMGVGYYKDITQWSKGEYADANQKQDDLSVMTGFGFGYRADDYGGSIGSATPLSGTNVSGAGIIERTGDADYFSFITGAGPIKLMATPTARSPNLDIAARLYNSAGTLLASNNPSGLGATVSVTVASGTYYLSIDGVGTGNPTNGYSDYGSLGQYKISGSVVSEGRWLPTAAGDYDWTNAPNWSPAGHPTGAGLSARVNNNIAGDQTISLDAAIRLGALHLGDSNGTHGFTVIAGSNGTLTLDAATGTARIVKTSGSNDALFAGIALADPAVVTNTAAGSLTLGGAIGGTNGLNKGGAGAVILLGTNTYTGETVIMGGPLRLGSNAQIRKSAAVDVRAGALLDASASAAGFPLVSNQTLRGAGAIAGAVYAARGSTVSPGGPAAAGTLTLSNALLAAAGAELELDLGPTTAVGGSANDLLVVRGDLALTSAIPVSLNFLTGVPATGGYYTLIRYSGALLAGGASSLTTDTSTIRADLVFDGSVTGEIRMIPSGGPAALVWKGGLSSNRWDLQSTSNWLHGAAADVFFHYDRVLFDATGSNAPSVALQGALKPGLVTVDGTKSYTLAGPGKLSGIGGIVKSGSATLTVNSTNDFTGAVTISNGTLKAGSPGALGATNGATVVLPGAVLDVGGQNLGSEPVQCAGKISNSGAEQHLALQFVTLTSNALFGGSGRWDLRANPGGKLTGNQFALTKIDANDVWLVDLGSTGLGDILVSRGTLGFEESTTMGTAARALTVVSNATLGFYNTDANVLNKVLGLSNGNVRSDSGDNAFAGPATLAGTNVFYVGAGLTLSGPVGGAGFLVKTNAGTLTLSGSNTWAGGGEVRAGTLAIGDGGTSGTPGDGGLRLTNGTVAFNRRDAAAFDTPIRGRGTVRHDGTNELTLSDVQLDYAGSSTYRISVGNSADGRGTLVVPTNGLLTAEYLLIGDQNNLEGRVLQLGGTVTVAYVRVQHWPGSTSIYDMNGGVLNVNTKLSVGWDGTGTFNHNGGTVYAKQLRLDDNGADPTGTYNLKGGALRLGSSGITSASTSTAAQLKLSGGGKLLAGANFTIASNVVVTLTGTSGSGNFDVSNFTVTVNAEIGGSGGLDTEGTGILVLNASNSFSGGVTVYGGVLLASNSYAFGSAAKTVNVTTPLREVRLGGNIRIPAAIDFVTSNDGSTNMAALRNVGGTNYILGDISLTSGGGYTLIDADAGRLVVSGTVSRIVNADRGLILGGDAEGEIAGPILNGTNAGYVVHVEKRDAGAWYLGGACSYGGTTTVAGGALRLRAGASFDPSRLIDVRTGAVLDVSAVPGFAVESNQTLMGGGTVSGRVTVLGRLTPGASIGTLYFSSNVTLSGTTVIEVARGAAPSCDVVQAAGPIAYGGALVVTNLGGTFAAGDTLRVFRAASYGGAFAATNLPALAAGLRWDLSRLGLDGSLAVAWIQHTLTVVSAHGGASPGTLTTNYGTALSPQVVNSPVTAGGTQYVCLGAAVAGNAYAQPAPTNVTLTLTNDAALTWRWATNVYFARSAGTNGAVTGAASGWYARGGGVTVTAAPAAYHHFAGWSGDVPAGQETANPLALTLDRARAVAASFAANLVTNGTPEWWLAQYGWTSNFNTAAAADQDGDRMPTWIEFRCLTVPTNAASYLGVMDLRPDPAGIVIQWQSASGKVYRVLRSAGLGDEFIAVVSSNVPAIGPLNTVTDPVPSTAFRHYRVELQ